MASDADQALADREQQASDRDQATADAERSTSPGSRSIEELEASRIERDAASRERDSTAAIRAKKTAERLVTAAQRDQVASVRDRSAAARDLTATARDDAAAARDRAAEARERRAVEEGNLDDALVTLRTLRVSGASIRERAASERMSAAADREAAAADREQAAADRSYAGLDELTGVLRRGMGELALTHEIDRSRRSGRSLVLAVIDIDALKRVNDTEGHAAGDALLRDVPAAIASALRSYDVTVRWGGDEFVCGLSDVTIDIASERVNDIQKALAARRPPASVSVGLAELRDGDTLESLVARADVALYRAKAGRKTAVEAGPVPGTG
jgi:diguanylate cyclase (GGDEF)-like protein